MQSLLRHIVESASKWVFKTPNDNRVNLDYTKIRYALGDLNGDKKLDNSDAAIMTEYSSVSDKPTGRLIAATYTYTF